MKMGASKQGPLCTSGTMLFSDDSTRWQAVQARDANADGHFVYAVKTTKIYCRPICKARLARRANVAFYDTDQQAVQAGFRACKRCKPELAGYMPEEAAVRKIRAFVQGRAVSAGTPNENMSSSSSSSSSPSLMSLSQMAKQTGLSKWHFHRVFKKCVGVTPSEFLRAERAASTAGSSAGSGETSPWMGSVSGSEFGVGGADWFTGGATFASDFAMEVAGLDFGQLGADYTTLGGCESSLLFDDFVAWPAESHYAE